MNTQTTLNTQPSTLKRPGRQRQEIQALLREMTSVLVRDNREIGVDRPVWLP